MSPLEEIIARFPDLSFHGSAWCEGRPEYYYTFEGRAGEISVTEYVMPDDFPREVQRHEIEREIEKLEAKISRLEAQLEWEQTLLERTPERDIPVFLPRDPLP